MDFLATKVIAMTLMFGKIGDPCNLPAGNPFFGLPHWWKYLGGKKELVDGSTVCAVAFKFPDNIWAVALALIDILVRIAGIVIVFFIIYAGVSYITSQGNAEKTTAARKRITNSLIGLGIVLIAAALVAFIGNTIGG